MSETWQRSGAIAAGGSVLSMRTSLKQHTWIVTGGGILSDDGSGWRPLPGSAPMEQTGLVGSADTDWWVAGLSGGLILTWDGGRSWGSAWIDQVSDPVTCFAASPRYASDITLLAGTAGAGVLRSTDGGRRWQLSNFGLREFTILALATAGDWSRRQVVFVGAADGVYRSSGGGRAWKSAGLEGLVVQALAAGQRPPPETSGEPGEIAMLDASGAWMILAGTEANGLFRTLDSGSTWAPCAPEIGDSAGINALLCHSPSDGEIWLAGTDEGHIWRSTDSGETWRLVCSVGGPVLSLAEGRDTLLAGTSERGLWASNDLGLTWRRDDTLCAWGFRRLYPAGGQGLAALAPTGGVWLSADWGQRWRRVLEASLYEPVLAYTTAGDNWLASRAGVLWRGGPRMEPVVVLETGHAPIVALASRRGQDGFWAGAADGALWVSVDEGVSWQALDTPFRDQRLLGVAFSPEDGTPLAGTFGEPHKEVTLWRYVDGRWQRWLSRSDTWAGFALAAAGKRGEESWAALGGRLYAHTAAGWRLIEHAAGEDKVAGITAATAAGIRYLISDSEVLRCDEAGGWRSLPLPEGGAAPVDLCLSPSGILLCLDAAGVVWRLPA